MAEQVSLLINGKQYRGWSEISLNTAMDALAGAFAISLTERWAGDGRTPSQIEAWPIMKGDRCQVTIDGEVIIDGYVDQFRPSFGPTDHTIEVQGRDKTCDLIDCSAFHQPDQWKNVDLMQIAKILCAPFGIKVYTEVDVGPRFDVVKLQQGETVFSALDRLARFRKVLMAPGVAGGLLFTQAGKTRATVRLQQGVNIKSGSGVLDDSQRFSNYIVKGQNVSSKTTDGELEAHAEARVTDSAVTRYRPLVIMAETGATNGSAADRATWEANVRLGRSAAATVTVRGWRQGLTGPLWKPNQLVGVTSSFLRMDGDMLIRQVTYKRSASSGTEVELSLVSPQAFSPEPPDKTKDKRPKTSGRNIWREALGDDEPST
jgi:prophage tail gpP-like protein